MTYRFWLVFGLTHLLFSSLFTPVAAPDDSSKRRLKCWTNFADKTALRLVLKMMDDAKTDAEQEAALALLNEAMAKDVEKNCSISEVCGKLYYSFKARRIN